MTHLDVQNAKELAQSAIERAEKATPDFWCLVHSGDDMFIQQSDKWLDPEGPTGPTILQLLHGHDSDTSDTEDDNQTFIVAARRDVPELAAALLQALDEIESQQDLKKRINDLEIENNNLKTVSGWRVYFEQHAKPLRDEIARLTELVEEQGK